MLKDALIFLETLYKKRPTIFCILVALIILVVDYLTGQYIQFPIFYILPIGMAAWQGEKHTAYIMAIILPCARIAFHFIWPGTHSLSTAMSNALIAICALMIYSFLIDRVSWQAKKLEVKVKTLEGILPICASCKRIRNEKGEYEQIESYITDHSDALFSHSICQDCAKKLYPEYLKDE